MIRYLVTLVALILLPGLAAGQAPHREPDGEISLWDGPGPGSEALVGELEEVIVERSSEPSVIRDRYVAGITAPRLQVFRPDAPNGSAMLVIPGGGYQRVVLDKEGYESAERLNAAGITAFVLIYRQPGEGHDDRSDVPLQDAQRAMRLIRHQAADYGIDPDRLGVIGFSAGGHVAGSIATRWDAGVYEPRDAADELSARPDHAVLVYPVTRMDGPDVHEGSRDRLLGTSEPDEAQLGTYDIARAVRADMPPVQIIHAIDDTSVPLGNALDVYRALLEAEVPSALHVFSGGGHGFGIRHTTGLPVAIWPDLVVDWVAAQDEAG